MQIHSHLHKSISGRAQIVKEDPLSNDRFQKYDLTSSGGSALAHEKSRVVRRTASSQPTRPARTELEEPGRIARQPSLAVIIAIDFQLSATTVVDRNKTRSGVEVGEVSRRMPLPY